VGVKVIGLMTHGVGVLHTNADLGSIDDVSGLKLRLGGGVAGDVGTALGATGINVPAPEVYTTLASNAADGVMMPMEGKASFRLYEVAKNTYTVPGGFYRGSFAIIMNQDRWDSLSAEDQAALEGRVRREPVAHRGCHVGRDRYGRHGRDRRQCRQRPGSVR
jgi:TRAP-type C4-dicarboxylate transport system substrate-binding protein